MTIKKLPKTAYFLEEGETFTPLTADQTLPEFTLKAAISGIFLGILFGAANTYLGLKAGLTISTSIPVAVLTVVIFRAVAAMGGKYSILETNMSQTIGSASSSVASGAIFTLPALFMWAAHSSDINPEWKQLTLLAMAGGLLGVLAMIPLRRFLIQREHGKLAYPEGMACAEVLVASEAGGSQAAGVFAGIGAGMFFKLLTSGFKVVPGSFQSLLKYPPKASLGIGVSPALIGVGFILGLRVASVMVAGAALSFLVIIPLINWWGLSQGAPVYPETEKLILDMSVDDLWDKYIRYIGAGAVATAGLITLVTSIPTMVESFRMGIAELGSGTATSTARTDRDLSFRTVLIWLAGIVGALILIPGILGYIDNYAVRAVAAVLAAVFAFFFVTVSARIVGLVGQTSNPISGMTIASLIGTSFVFLMFGWTDLFGQATALMVGTVICIAASIAGDTSQDLKTGFILGATPRTQQIGELLGVITSAGVICAVLILLDKTYTLGSEELPAPQATLMRLVIEGVLQRNLPWTLIAIGAALSVVVALFRLPALAFAVGVYLPLETMAAIFVGGLLRWAVTRTSYGEMAERRRAQGILFSSGLVGGGGLTGVLLALWVTVRKGERIVGASHWLAGLSNFTQQLMALAAIALIGAAIFGWSVRPIDEEREEDG
jgi:putative OPT family oligopeptide transporter